MTVLYIFSDRSRFTAEVTFHIHIEYHIVIYILVTCQDILLCSIKYLKWKPEIFHIDEVCIQSKNVPILINTRFILSLIFNNVNTKLISPRPIHILSIYNNPILLLNIMIFPPWKSGTVLILLIISYYYN